MTEMNLSTISVYDNVDTPDSLSKSCEYRTINDLLTVNSAVEVRIYCPLCIKYFNFELSLFEHLKAYHSQFLTRTSNQSMQFKECPFCDAKFYGRHLTVKHALFYHSKVIKGVFLQKSKCFFCDVKLSKKEYSTVVKHIEDNHFLDFEEEFRKMFPSDNTLEMSMFELISSFIVSECSANFEDIFYVDVRKGNFDSQIQDFDGASKINCFDFTDLKQQLDDIKSKVPSVLDSGKKSTLKDLTNTPTTQRSVRRVLRFDLSSVDENKENLIMPRNLKTFKELGLDENNLLFNENKIDKFLKLNDTFLEEPQHSSTPNKIMSSHCMRPVKCKSSFKSYITDKKIKEYEFQCGRCKTFFKENLDLVLHVKKNHKIFNLNAFQPCYRCAICNARFYKNYYLRKHHNLHKPY